MHQVTNDFCTLDVWFGFQHSAVNCEVFTFIFTVRHNARIASAVLAIAIPCVSVRLSVRLSHAGIVSKQQHVARSSLHCQIAICVWFCRNQQIFPRDDPSPEILAPNDLPSPNSSRSWHVLPCSTSTVRASKKSSVTGMTNRKSFTGFTTSI